MIAGRLWLSHRAGFLVPSFAAATPAATTPIVTIASATSVAPIATRFAAVGSLHIAADRNTGFNFVAFFQRGFARKFHAALVVDADAFDPDHLADLDDVFGPLHAEVGQLGDVDEAVLAREHFDEGAEFFDRDDATVIDLADFDLASSCRR